MIEKNNFVSQFFTFLISLGVILCNKLQIRCGLCIAIPEIWVANCDATPLILSLAGSKQEIALVNLGHVQEP
jgi:hypothetical protein